MSVPPKNILLKNISLKHKPRSILFVCLGNICRSPAAHGVFEHLLKAQGMHNSIEVDSAGTAAYHVGNKADARMRQTAKTRGVDLEALRARAVQASDFEEFDLILAMDEDNLFDLNERCPEHLRYKLALFLEFAEHSNLRSVPDPYYGGQAGFEQVMDLVFDASENLLKQIRSL